MEDVGAVLVNQDAGFVQTVESVAAHMGTLFQHQHPPAGLGQYARVTAPANPAPAIILSYVIQFSVLLFHLWVLP